MLILMRVLYHKYSWMEYNNLYQVIKDPTRVTSHSATLLDLMITNYPGYFVFSDVLSPPSGCDHSFVYARINVFLDKQKCYKRQIWDFKTIDYTVLRQNLLNIDYDNIVTKYIYYKWHKEFRIDDIYYKFHIDDIYIIYYFV